MALTEMQIRCAVERGWMFRKRMSQIVATFDNGVNCGRVELLRQVDTGIEVRRVDMPDRTAIVRADRLSVDDQTAAHLEEVAVWLQRSDAIVANVRGIRDFLRQREPNGQFRKYGYEEPQRRGHS